MNLQKEESCGKQGDAELFFVHCFVDQIKSLPEPDSSLSLLHQRTISFYVMRDGKKKKKKSQILFQSLSMTVPLVQPELVATKHPCENS